MESNFLTQCFALTLWDLSVCEIGFHSPVRAVNFSVHLCSVVASCIALVLKAHEQR